MTGLRGRTAQVKRAAFVLATVVTAAARALIPADSATAADDPLANLPSRIPKPNGYDPSVEGTARIPLRKPMAASSLASTSWGVNYTETCAGETWNVIQAVSNGLPLGNCQAGTPLYTHVIEQISNPTAGQSPFFHGGYVGGNFNGCGWVNANRVTNTTLGNPVGACTDPNHADKREFAYCTSPNFCTAAGANLAIWTSPNGNDGVLVNNPNQPCPEYANYQPWRPSQAKNDATPITAPPGSNRLLLRYLARYPVAGTNNAWVAMVHDNYNQYAKWVFVPWTCLTT